MSLLRWEPIRELEDLNKRLNRIFAHPAAHAHAPETEKNTVMRFDWSPTVDVIETPEEFEIKAELPEVKREDVKLSIDNGVLRLAGERKFEKEESGRKYHRVERAYGSFLRTFTLPDNVDEANIRAEFNDGMLKVRLPKAQKNAPKSIEVKIG